MRFLLLLLAVLLLLPVGCAKTEAIEPVRLSDREYVEWLTDYMNRCSDSSANISQMLSDIDLEDDESVMALQLELVNFLTVADDIEDVRAPDRLRHVHANMALAFGHLKSAYNDMTYWLSYGDPYAFEQAMVALNSAQIFLEQASEALQDYRRYY